ncbi:MAG: hypothetical protein COB51_10345 [Moraxellaceae bacterium]|nr:MAG: hypothetical protein COB51_10345 [Moraxellaceae bacterium]
MARIKRLCVFLKERFPIPYALLGVMSFLAVYWGFFAVDGLARVSYSWSALVGTVSVVLMMLLMRIYDELKDVDTDIRLGAAGDPRFVNRPIVTGAVRKEDIVFLRWLVTAGLFIINFGLIGTPALPAFLILFFIGWLSYQWFFIPAISRNILLALVTHNPLVLLQSLYIYSIYYIDSPSSEISAWHMIMIVGLWMPFAIWETARKIRVPEEESEYETYSSKLGLNKAVAMPFVFTVISVTCLVVFSNMASLPYWFVLLVVGGGGVMLLRCVLLWVAPTRRRSELRPFGETYMLIVNIGVISAVLSAKELILI